MNIVISNLFQSMDNISVCVYSMARNNRVNCNIVNIYIKKERKYLENYFEKLIHGPPVRRCENKFEDTMCALEQPDSLPLPQLRPNFGT